MTDSEDDLLSKQIFTYPTESTTCTVRGPHTETTKIRLDLPNMSKRHNQLPQNWIRQRYAESCCDQRSMQYRREVSPQSMRSGYTMPRNFYNSYYPNDNYSQRSYNGRGASPMSLRSIDSTASISAADIAMAFKNAQFTKTDWKIITSAFRKYNQKKASRKMTKRKYIKSFLRKYRRKSDDDSGEQGSDSSLSSSEESPIRNVGYKNYMTSCNSTTSELTNKETNIKNKNIPRDFNQYSVKNIPPSVELGISNNNQNKSTQRMPQNIPVLKDRFKNSLILPSQRFNRLIASSAILEDSKTISKNMQSGPAHTVINHQINKNVEDVSDSEEEHIFSNTVIKTRQNLDKENIVRNDKKGQKISPIKKIFNNEIITSQENSMNDSDFIFAKPTFPAKKSNAKKSETLIASSVPLITEYDVNQESQKAQDSETIAKHINDKEQIDANENTSNLSSRPSFSKRKLYTQRLEVSEKQNVSSDNVLSPQVDRTLLKEKTKPRKIVTAQSCLSRDITNDDSNVQELIHKIVKPTHLSITNQKTNTTNLNRQTNSSLSISTNKPSEKTATKTNGTSTLNSHTDKCDIISIISINNQDEISDTYTDEEIFEATLKASERNAAEMKDVKNKIPSNKNNAVNNRLVKNNKNETCITNNVKTTAQATIKSFWDTDLDSELENSNTPRKKINYTTKTGTPLQEGIAKNHLNYLGSGLLLNSDKDNLVNHKENVHNVIGKNQSTLNDTLNVTSKNVYRLENTLKIRSHRIPKRKQCCVDDTPDAIKSNLEKPHKKNKIDENNISVMPALPKSDTDVTLTKKKEIKHPKTTNKSKISVKSNTDNDETVHKTKKQNNRIPHTDCTVKLAKLDLSKSLRSREINISNTSINKNEKKNSLKAKERASKSVPPKNRISDVSFSLSHDDRKVNKKTNKKPVIRTCIQTRSSLANKSNMSAY